MAQPFARAFYRSKAWKHTRYAYFKFAHGLCERCMERGTLSKGEIVHHKEHLTPENINDPDISLGFDNLELLCRACHAEVHPEIYGRDEIASSRVAFDENGDLIDLEGKEAELWKSSKTS